MSKQSASEGSLTEAAQAAADFGAAAGAVDEAAATAFGVNRTDLRIIGLVEQAGTLTAGRLADASGLSPAATSTAIQRLVAAGHLTRTIDDEDRRRVVLALTTPADALLGKVYTPIGRAGRRELCRYSPDEIALIIDFLRQGKRLQLTQAARIRRLVKASRAHPTETER